MFVPPELAGEANAIVESCFKDWEQVTGFKLRPEKTKTVTPTDFEEKGADVLGSHVGPGKLEFLAARLEEFQIEVERLKQVSKQDAFLLLVRCYRPQWTHLLRTMKVSKRQWKKVDKVFLDLVQWLGTGLGAKLTLRKELVGLPQRLGGLGLSLPTQVADNAYKASENESMKFLHSRFPEGGFNANPEATPSQSELMKSTWKETVKESCWAL